MGIAWLLLKRTFANRPRRTLLFILGYALATAVMITLLSVGEAVLLQARDKDLVGGGDIVLVPQGIDIENLKLRGISALYYSIPQARFIVRQLLASSRFENEISNVSPYITSRLLYIRKATSPVEAVYGDGSFPDQESRIKKFQLPWHNSPADEKWLKPELSSFYQEMDHFHLPSVQAPSMDQWAEWHYFNFEGEKFYGYLSFMVAGDILKDQAKWILSLQFYDGRYRRYADIEPAKKSQLPLTKIEYSVGKNGVRFAKDHYELDLKFGNAPVAGQIEFFPNHRLALPPTILARSSNFESGYVIPALRGTYQGYLDINGKKYDMNGISGYHDHNWGMWQQPANSSGEPVHWNWGHAYSEDYSILYGELFVGGKSRGLFCGVFDQKGFLTMFRPQKIMFANYTKGKEGISVPTSLRISQTKPYSSIQLNGRESSFIASAVGTPTSMYFIQYKMNYDISLSIDGKEIYFRANGNAETFVPSDEKSAR